MKLPFKVDKSKLERQKEALRKWRENEYQGTLEAATAFGKTFVGIMACQEANQTLGSDCKKGVCVPTDYLRNKWNEEKQLHGVPDLQVDTINGWMNKLDNGIELEFDLWIMDEIHGYTGGEVWSTSFDRVKYDRILGLTAKERMKEEDQALLSKYAPIVDQIPMSVCLERGWVSPFIVYNYGLDLSPFDRKRYNDMHQKFIKYFSTFFGYQQSPLNLMFRCLSDEKFREKFADGLNWEPKMVLIHAANANRTMQKRKQFLYTNDSIFDASVEIIRSFPDKRIITFSEVTSFADRLAEEIDGSVVYHSSLATEVRDKDTGEVIAVGVKNKNNKTRYKRGNKHYKWSEIKKEFKDKSLERFSGDRRREEALKDFLEGRSDIIHSATALNEGVDISGIDMSVKNSFNSTIINAIQRTGRTVRKDDKNPNKRAIEVNLYIRDTQSEKWLRKSQDETPNIKEISSIQEIV